MYRAIFERAEPSIVHSLSISKRERDFETSARAAGIFVPMYSAINSPFLNIAAAKSPCPVPARDFFTTTGVATVSMQGEYNTWHVKARKGVDRKLQGRARFLPCRPVYPTLPLRAYGACVRALRVRGIQRLHTRTGRALPFEDRKSTR